MRNFNPNTLRLVLTLLAGVLVCKVTVAVVLNYVNYYPPNFGSDFLHGRQPYFWGRYHWAFYTHIASGPVSLILGTILVSERFRLRFPVWHRGLGRVQVACVLLLVAPSGLWMAYFAAAGPIGAMGLAALAVASGSCVALGFRAAVKRRFADHRRWMWRTYLLLCSAVVLRIIGGSATATGFAPDWLDPLATWISWLAPITVFEAIEWGKRRDRHPSARLEMVSRGA